MFELLGFLVAIRYLAKDVHYQSKGQSFWSDHLLADKVADNLDGFIDEVNENGFLGHQEEAPQQSSVLEEATEYIKDSVRDFYGLDQLILRTLTHIEMIKDKPEISMGDSDLLGRISNDLQTKHGLLWRRLG